MSWQLTLKNLPTERIDKCALCECAGRNDSRFRALLKLLDPYQVQQCPNCGLRWLSPRPNAEGYRQLYSGDSYFGGSGASPVDYASVVVERLSYFRKRIRRAATLIGASGALSILDYGAATGEFVAVAREEGHLCDGIELSDDARAQAEQHLGVRLYSPDQIESLVPERFDVLHMNHVLEHVPDPVKHIQWCAKMLKPGGLLVIEVPQQFDNDLDCLRRLIGWGGQQQRFDAYSLHHTYFFSPSCLQSLLERGGFEVSQLRTFNPDKTPLWPIRPSLWALFALLSVADKAHKGGNIIEVFAARKYA